MGGVEWEVWNEKFSLTEEKQIVPEGEGGGQAIS